MNSMMTDFYMCSPHWNTYIYVDADLCAVDFLSILRRWKSNENVRTNTRQNIEDQGIELLFCAKNLGRYVEIDRATKTENTRPCAAELVPLNWTC